MAGITPTRKMGGIDACRRSRLLWYKSTNLPAWKFCLCLFLAGSDAPTFTVMAQHRGPITIYLVNDSQEELTAVWLNQLRVVNDELIPIRTGPIPPGAIEKFKAYPYDGIELHKADEQCGTQKGTVYNPRGTCPSTLVKVKKADGEYPTNIILLAPNFIATSEAVLNPSHLIKAMREGIHIDASIRILNQSGRDANLFWLSQHDKGLISMADAPMQSRQDPYYFRASVYHQFVLQEICERGEDCRIRYFRVTAKEIEITIGPNFDVQWEQIPYQPFAKFTYTPSVDLFQQCHDYVRPELHFEHPDTIIATIDRCIQDHWDKAAWEHQPKPQIYLDANMEKYVCDEPRMATTGPAEINLWTNERDQTMRTVFVLHKSESSQIHLISNFVSPEECQAIEEAAAGNFQPTQTSDGKGGHRPNLVRKAQIARVDVDWESPDDPITQTGHRVFDYVQYVHPSLEISPNGQEPLVAIHYHGRGRDDPNPDQYKSHYDSDCNGKPTRVGQRVATVVMYCQMPKEGGHTNFRSAHVHIKPQPGNAIFFSYVNAATKVQDNGMTIHSGCPVYEGTKKIVTQWFRYGVNKDHPYTEYPL